MTPDDLLRYLTFFAEKAPLSVEALVLQRGMQFNTPSFLENFHRIQEFKIKRRYQVKQQCFRNCAMLASRRLTYVEGVAVSRATGLPTHHAWLVTRDGRVIDPTWFDVDILGTNYYGIPLRTKYVNDTAASIKYWSVFHWKNENLIKHGLPKKAISRRAS